MIEALVNGGRDEIDKVLFMEMIQDIQGDQISALSILVLLIP